MLAGYLSAQVATSTPPVTALWATNDAGDLWLPLQDFPHLAPTSTYISLEPNVAGSYPWNIIYRELIGPPATNLDNVAEIPNGQAEEKGHAWVTLPPLPVPDADAHHDGIAEVVGVASRGELLVFGPNPRTGASAGSSQPGSAAPPQPDRLWGLEPGEPEMGGQLASALPVIPEEAILSWGPGPLSADRHLDLDHQSVRQRH